jgi:hypothetical protein
MNSAEKFLNLVESFLATRSYNELLLIISLYGIISFILGLICGYFLN